MANEARIRKAFRAIGVNLKSAAGTIIIPALAGKFFVPRQAFAVMVTRTGSGVVPSFKIGNAGTFDIHAAGALGNSAHLAGEVIEIPIDGTSRTPRVDIGTTGISVTITVASTFTTDTADFYLEGYVL
jgi:hypothetical protein